MTVTYRNLVVDAVQSLVGAKPDGLAARQGLLLAAHAGLHRADGPGSADWDFFTAAVTEAVVEVQADLTDTVMLAPGVPAPGPDTVHLRQSVVELIRALADLYAASASTPDSPPWRRLAWGRVAHLLDHAGAQLA
jgi:hypothetical protein